MTRRRRLPGSNRYASETLIVSDRGVVAVLGEGDPLRYLLGLPLAELKSTKQGLPLALQDLPQAVEVLEALIEYKETLESEKQSTG